MGAPEPIRSSASEMGRSAWRWLAAGMTALGLGASALAVDTTIVARAMGPGSSLYKDRNNDGIVTDADFALGAFALLGQGPDGDVDGDGVLTAADTIEAVAKILRGSQGDANGDAVIDEADLGAVLDAITGLADDLGKDANADGVMDELDFQYVLEKVLTSADAGVWSDTSIVLTQYLQQVRIEGAEAFMADQSDTPQHHVAITEGWMLPPRHSTEDSLEVWPPNHYKFRSLAWPDRRDDPARDPWPKHTKENSKKWPPNHNPRISSDWTEPLRHRYEDSRRGDPYHPWRHPQDHDTSGSDIAHNEFYSELWRRTPNHHRHRSVTWDPDGPTPATPPLDPNRIEHELSRSVLWPTDHVRSDSIVMPRPVPVVHASDVSCTWCLGSSCSEDDEAWRHPPGSPPCWRNPASELLRHGLQRSVVWPGSHGFTVSNNWQPHDRALSFAWPPNHVYNVSAGWPERLVPGQWPPNHLATVSQNPSAPTTRGPADWPTWPPNHDWLTTIRQVIEIPSGVAPFLPFVPAVP